LAALPTFPPATPVNDATAQSSGAPSQPLAVRHVDHPDGPPVRAVQIHNRYLVAESQEGVIVFDQHALHERILYEQLRSRLANGSLERQKLLVPQPVDLTPAEASAALEHRELLAELGLDIQPFGGNTVVVSAYPAILSRIDPSDALRDLVAQLLSGGGVPDRRHLLESLLQRMACRSAVKAGDRLAPDEIRSLLEQRHVAADSHHCPHGRPTSLVLTREDLDRQFKRI
jgi:DNA mismatch repair protein MutL